MKKLYAFLIVVCLVLSGEKLAATELVSEGAAVAASNFDALSFAVCSHINNIATVCSLDRGFPDIESIIHKVSHGENSTFLSRSGWSLGKVVGKLYFE